MSFGIRDARSPNQRIRRLHCEGLEHAGTPYFCPFFLLEMSLLTDSQRISIYWQTGESMHEIATHAFSVNCIELQDSTLFTGSGDSLIHATHIQVLCNRLNCVLQLINCRVERKCGNTRGTGDLCFVCSLLTAS